MKAALHSALDSYSHGVGATPLLGQTIGDNLRATIERCGDRDALVVCWQNYRATYRELGQVVTRAARALLALGVAAGDRVGVWSPNRWEWVVVQYATARVGAVLVNINPAYQAAELEYALRQSGVGLLFHARGFRQLIYGPMLDAARPRCPELKQALRFDEDWQEFLASGASVAETALAEREQTLQFDEPINIQYTSGTTGFPKGATLTHHNILNNGFFVGEALGLTERDRMCIPVPLYHCFGMVLGCLACTSHGACMVLPAECFAAPGRFAGDRGGAAAQSSTAFPPCFARSSKTPPLRTSIVPLYALASCRAPRAPSS